MGQLNSAIISILMLLTDKKFPVVKKIKIYFSWEKMLFHLIESFKNYLYFSYLIIN